MYDFRQRQGVDNNDTVIVGQFFFIISFFVFNTTFFVPRQPIDNWVWERRSRGNVTNRWSLKTYLWQVIHQLCCRLITTPTPPPNLRQFMEPQSFQLLASLSYTSMVFKYVVPSNPPTANSWPFTTAKPTWFKKI